MKQRVKVDNLILHSTIIITAFLYLFPHLYPTSTTFDNVMDFLGLMFLLKGIMVRMSARGHKKVSSRNGSTLVTTGIYSLTRNPMYLGTFYMGTGFLLIAWPWWTLPLFAAMFYIRFDKEIRREEDFLYEQFGEEYVKYCRKVPRAFPSMEQLRKAKLRKVFNPQEIWSTKEKMGLLWCPFLAVILETIQEKRVFLMTDVWQTVLVFLLAMAVFSTVVWVEYQTRN